MSFCIMVLFTNTNVIQGRVSVGDHLGTAGLEWRGDLRGRPVGERESEGVDALC
jgi:hypothetical protein